MNIEKLLKNYIKIAAVALTSPATLSVAGNLYPDQPVYRVLVQTAALILVEGALILGWWQLDNDRRAEMPQRVLYATLASVALLSCGSSLSVMARKTKDFRLDIMRLMRPHWLVLTTTFYRSFKSFIPSINTPIKTIRKPTTGVQRISGKQKIPACPTSEKKV